MTSTFFFAEPPLPLAFEGDNILFLDLSSFLSLLSFGLQACILVPLSRSSLLVWLVEEEEEEEEGGVVGAGNATPVAPCAGNATPVATCAGCA